ncbi:MAG: hypothetical protein JEZ08_02695 [Clostridiales bacterium]|nr:hypothetical protein [Clostridiales bacterium]
MKRKRRSNYQFNDAVLKNGYEAMAQINLGFAEAGMSGDSDDFMSYEKILATNTFMERDDFDD